MLREDLMKSRQAERLAKQKLVEVTSSPDVFSVSTMLPDAARCCQVRNACIGRDAFAGLLSIWGIWWTED